MAFPHSSATLRREIEARLAGHIPGALSPPVQQTSRWLPVGVPAVEELLGGGLPLGGISEFTGSPGSGRTTLALSVLAGATHETACAYVDVHGCLDPWSAAAAGVLLSNLLWVRLGSASEPISMCRATPAPGVQPVCDRQPYQQGRGGPHPRAEGKGMGKAVGAVLGTMLDKQAEARLHRAENTPGFPNQKLGLVRAPAEQIAYAQLYERRRGMAISADPFGEMGYQRTAIAKKDARQVSALRLAEGRTGQKSWPLLDRAIRATDQILQAGGFRLVVLDLAGVPPEHAQRIPAATWFRFRRAAQEAAMVLLVLTEQPCARSSALCVLECAGGTARILPNSLFSAAGHTVAVARQRTGTPLAKKAPGRVAAWEAKPAWMRAAGDEP